VSVGREGEFIVIALGLILLLVGFLAHIGILWTLGIVVLVVGVVLFALGSAGHAIGGRRHYW
jgi:fatty-acid desaturase